MSKVKFLVVFIIGIGTSGCFLDSENTTVNNIIYETPDVSRESGCFTEFFHTTSNKHMILEPDPEVDGKIQSGVVGEYYEQVLKAEIRNEPDDNDYSYFFDYSGDFPSGLVVSIENRTFTISGYPEKSGTYEVFVWVQSSELEEEMELAGESECKYHIKFEKFTLTVLN